MGFLDININNSIARRSAAADTPAPQKHLEIPRWVSLLPPMFVTAIVLLPILLLVVQIVTPDAALWSRMWSTFLPRAARNTLVLVLGVGAGTFVIGTGFAWLVSAYDFPGRRWFEHLLLLPLAIPGFIMGFVFVSIFEFAGPVQTQLRVWFGREVWFPDITSAGGLILILTLVLYPYVYILARAAFQEQAASTFEAAQVMGYNRTQTFLKLVLPMARPSLVAGSILAMMEAMTDYGTVSFFGFPTLSERIVVLWNTEYDAAPAIELASVLLLFALGVLVLERLLRGRARYYQQGASRGRRPRRKVIRGAGRWMATGACLLLVGVAFVLPAAQLGAWTVTEVRDPSVGVWDEIFLEYTGNSVMMAGIAAAVVVILALVVAYGVRHNAGSTQRSLPKMLSRLVTLGYAMPGAVIAAGVLVFVNPIDGAVTRFAENFLGWASPAYVLTGTIIAVVYAYLVRFMSVGFNSVESSMDKVTPTMEEAARTMGASPLRVLWRVQLPLVSTGMAAGAILVFVDVMKELPATLLLRPFGMDTLALWAYFLSMEGFWEAASIPSLTIVVTGLIPVFILMRVGDNNADDRH